MHRNFYTELAETNLKKKLKIELRSNLLLRNCWRNDRNIKRHTGKEFAYLGFHWTMRQGQCVNASEARQKRYADNPLD